MMSWVEKLLLLAAVVEIPLQVDTFLFYQEEDAAFGAIAGINLSITTLCLGGLYLCWLMRSALRPRLEATSWVGNTCLVAYLAVVTLSTVVARDPALGFFELTMLLQAFALFFYVANRPQTREDVLYSVAAVATCLAIQSGLIIATRYVTGPRSIGPLSLAMEADLRPGGTMISPVLAGSELALLTPPVVALASLPLAKRRRILLAGVGILAVLAVAVTQTRGAILSLGCSACVLGYCLGRRGWLPKKTFQFAAIVALLAIFPLLHVIRSRVVEGDEGSASARVHLAAIARKAIFESPLFGHGAGNSHHALRPYADGGAFRSEWFFTVHCKYLLVWVETGAVGLVAFIGFLVSTLRRGWRAWSVGDRWLSPLALACTAAIAGQMIHMAVDVFNSRQQVTTLWLFAGIIVGIDALLRSQSADVRPASTPAFVRKEFAHGW